MNNLFFSPRSISQLPCFRRAKQEIARYPYYTGAIAALGIIAGAAAYYYFSQNTPVPPQLAAPTTTTLRSINPKTMRIFREKLDLIQTSTTNHPEIAAKPFQITPESLALENLVEWIFDECDTDLLSC